MGGHLDTLSAAVRPTRLCSSLCVYLRLEMLVSSHNPLSLSTSTYYTPYMTAAEKGEKGFICLLFPLPLVRATSLSATTRMCAVLPNPKQDRAPLPSGPWLARSGPPPKHYYPYLCTSLLLSPEHVRLEQDRVHVGRGRPGGQLPQLIEHRDQQLLQLVLGVLVVGWLGLPIRRAVMGVRPGLATCLTAVRHTVKPSD